MHRTRSCLVVASLTVALAPVAAAAAPPPGMVLVVGQSSTGGFSVLHGESGGGDPRVGLQAVVSPDGAQIALVVHDQLGSRVAVEGTDLSAAPQHFVTGEGYDHPRWSGASLLVRHQLDSDHYVTAWLLSTDGASEPVDRPDIPLDGVLSPGLAYVARLTDDGTTVVTDLAGRNPWTITSGASSFSGHETLLVPAAWSPDGTRIGASFGDFCTDVRAATIDTRTGASSVLMPLQQPGGITYRVDAFEPGSTRMLLSTGRSDSGGKCEIAGSGVAAIDTNGANLVGINAGALDPDTVSAGGPPPAPDTTPPASVTGLTATAHPGSVRFEYARPPDPDEAGVIVRYAVGAVAPASPTSGLDGGRALGPVATVSHLPPDTTFSFSVFAADWSGNTAPAESVTVTTPHALLLDIAPMPDRTAVQYGRRAHFSTRITRDDTGAGVAGVPVSLVVGNPAHPLLVAHAVTDGYGRASRQIAVRTRHQKLRWVVAPTTDHTGALATTTLAVAPHVTLRVPSSLRRGAHIVATVVVRPAWAVVTTIVSNGGRHVVRLHDLDGGRQQTGTIDLGPATRRRYLLTLTVATDAPAVVINRVVRVTS